MAKRNAVLPDSAAHAAQALCDQFISAYDFAPDTVLAAYMPMGSEIDCLPLVEFLRARGMRIVLPRVSSQQNDTAMTFHLWRGEELIVSELGFAAPAADTQILTPQIVLLPLVGFDRAGNRLGYGKGYYDRALSRLLTTKKIGLAYALQEVKKCPREEHDKRLDAIVTEQDVINCKDE